MATTKTKVDVTKYINALPDEKNRVDSFKLVEIMSGITGFKPYMWGPSIIGFGNYHYIYESGHEGDAPIAAFSPRKNAIVLYISKDFPERAGLLKQFGKHKAMVSCIYIKKLEDIKIPVLKKLISACIKQTKKQYPD